MKIQNYLKKKLLPAKPNNELNKIFMELAREYDMNPQCAASAFAIGQMEKTSKILSQIGYMYLIQEDFRQKVLAEFPSHKA
jgi:hypothetical protein